MLHKEGSKIPAPGEPQELTATPPNTSHAVNGWIPLPDHLVALRLADQRFYDERDRRYAEVKMAEEKALEVKKEGDEKALNLSRENQLYRDERANNLRDQLSEERGTYVTQRQLWAFMFAMVSFLAAFTAIVAQISN